MADLEAEPIGHGVLPLFDATIHELFHPSAVQADDVVMVRTLVEFEHGHAVLEMVTRDQPRSLELSQDAIDRGQADVFARIQQPLVDVFRGHMPARTALEDIEDFKPRQRDLQPGLSEIFTFQVSARMFGYDS